MDKQNVFVLLFIQKSFALVLVVFPLWSTKQQGTAGLSPLYIRHFTTVSLTKSGRAAGFSFFFFSLITGAASLGDFHFQSPISQLFNEKHFRN